MQYALVVGLIVSCLTTACARLEDGASPARAEVVYGVDDRVEPYAHPNAALRAVADNAIAVEMSRSALDERDPANVRVTYSRTLGEAQSLCAGQAFASQIEPGTCSGTLIDDRHILTASHCVDETRDCDGSRVWVIGFRYASAGALARLDSNDVYTCQRIVAFDADADHAFVELDRPVIGHTPATLGGLTRLSAGLSLALIGHPNGLPMKIASGGRVTVVYADGSYAVTVDAFHGNSGSGVFDDAGRLVGVLTSGMDDYVAAGSCNVVNVLDPPPTDDGESMLGAPVAIDAFCAAPGLSSPVCACDGPCVTAPLGDTCDTALPLTVTGPMRVSDTLAGFAPDTAGSCGGNGPDRVYAITLERAGHLSAHSDGFDSVLYFTRGCGGAELACNDDISDADRGSRVEADLAPGDYRLFLDAYDGTVGAFTLDLDFTESTGPVVGADAAVPPDAGTPGGPDGGGDVVPPSGRSGGGCGCVVAGRDDAGGLGGRRALPSVFALAFVFVFAGRGARLTRRAPRGRGRAR